MKPTRCNGIKKDGMPCKSYAVDTVGFCYMHKKRGREGINNRSQSI